MANKPPPGEEQPEADADAEIIAADNAEEQEGEENGDASLKK